MKCLHRGLIVFVGVFGVSIMIMNDVSIVTYSTIMENSFNSDLIHDSPIQLQDCISLVCSTTNLEHYFQFCNPMIQDKNF